jgi:hypothetical protein
LKKIKAAWSKPFCDAETGYKLVIADLSTMNDNMKVVHSDLGEPDNSEHQGQTIWETLDHLQVTYADLENTTVDLEGKMFTGGEANAPLELSALPGS